MWGLLQAWYLDCQIKPNLLLYSLYDVEACNELAGFISTSLRLAYSTHLLLKKCLSGGEPLTTLCPI